MQQAIASTVLNQLTQNSIVPQGVKTEIEKLPESNQYMLVCAIIFPWWDLVMTALNIRKHKYEDIHYIFHFILVSAALITGIVVTATNPTILNWCYTTFPPTKDQAFLAVYLISWGCGTGASVTGKLIKDAALMLLYKDTKYYIKGSRLRSLTASLHEPRENIESVFKFLRDRHYSGEKTIHPRPEPIVKVLEAFMYKPASEVRAMYKYFLPFHDAALDDTDPGCILTNERHLAVLSPALELEPAEVRKMLRYYLNKLKEDDPLDIKEDEDMNNNPFTTNKLAWLKIIYNIMKGDPFIAGLASLHVNSVQLERRRLLVQIAAAHKNAAEGVSLLKRSPRPSLANEEEEHYMTGVPTSNQMTIVKAPTVYKQTAITFTDSARIDTRKTMPNSYKESPRIEDRKNRLSNLSDVSLGPLELTRLESSVKTLVRHIIRRSGSPDATQEELIDKRGDVTNKGLEVAQEYLFRQAHKIETEVRRFPEPLGVDVVSALENNIDESLKSILDVEKATPKGLFRPLSGNEADDPFDLEQIAGIFAARRYSNSAKIQPPHLHPQFSLHELEGDTALKLANYERRKAEGDAFLQFSKELTKKMPKRAETAAMLEHVEEAKMPTPPPVQRTHSDDPLKHTLDMA